MIPSFQASAHRGGRSALFTGHAPSTTSLACRLDERPASDLTAIRLALFFQTNSSRPRLGSLGFQHWATIDNKPNKTAGLHVFVVVPCPRNGRRRIVRQQHRWACVGLADSISAEAVASTT